MRAMLFFALLLSSSTALAVEQRPWSVFAAVGNVWLGPPERPTGGASVSLGGRYSWPLGKRAMLDAGLSAETFGFAGGSHWMALIVGPSAGVSVSPVEGLRLGLDFDVPYGRVPVCNDWGLCLRYWGIYPGAALHALYGGETVGAVVDVTVRLVDTLGWTGISKGITGGGVFRW